MIEAWLSRFVVEQAIRWYRESGVERVYRADTLVDPPNPPIPESPNPPIPEKI